MSLESLLPIEHESLLGMSLLPNQVMGNHIELHTETKGLPELKGLDVAIIGLHEYRNSFLANTQYDINSFRKEFYGL